MADNAGRVANMARSLAIGHIIVGSLLICFGIADCALLYSYTSYVGFGIWIGVWMCVAGGLGIPGTRKARSTCRDALAGVFMGFSITSAVFGGIIIICYSVAIAFPQDYNSDPYNNFVAYKVVGVVILMLGTAEFAIGIWAAACLCVMKPCTCCYGNPQQGQMMYPPNSGHTIAQYPGGAPVAVPIQAVTPGPQGGQPQTVMVPVSGMVGNQPQFAQVGTSGALTTGFQPQFAQVATPQSQMPPTYGNGRYMKLENDDSPVNT